MSKNDLGAPRTIHIIAHAKVFDLVEGWNEIDDQPFRFQLEDHGFNFDYLLHLSGINYLIHPEDVDQIISMIKSGDSISDYRVRFINRSGEMKVMRGSGRLVVTTVPHEINILT